MAYDDIWFISKFKLFEDKTAIIHKNRKFTYRELFLKTGEYFTTLKGKIAPGEVIALVSDYSFDSIALFFALIRNKNCIVPITSIIPSEISKKIRISNAVKKIEFHNDQIGITGIEGNNHIELLDKLRASGHSGLILFSSGITGEPKAMVHDLDILVKSYEKDTVKDVNTIIFLTFDHIGGIDTLFSLLSIGGAITIPESRDPEAVTSLIEKNKVNVLSCSPTFLNLLILSEAYKNHDLSSLKIIGFGAEAMPEFLFKKLREIFPEVKFQQKFGTSETNAIRVKNNKDDLYMKIDDPHIQYRIVDDELWLKSNTQILGYLNSDMTNFEDGWFKTGDIVKVNEDGFFRIIGRKKEIINVGGEKVFPGEVENVIQQVKCVAECSVYGVNNLITGEMVVAEATLKPDCDTNEVKKLIRELCTLKLDVYKRPSKIKIVDQITVNERFKKVRRQD
jgi:acyl-CoA synthetase (AMP-forming)/AMP-acid ligase II